MVNGEPTALAELEAIVDRLIDGKYCSLTGTNSGLAAKLRDLAEHLEGRSRSALRHAVGISIFLNDTVTEAVQTLRSIREMSQRMATISAATEELVSTVQAISRTSELAASNAQSVQGISDEGARDTETVVNTMRDIVASVNDTAERAERLASSSQQIGSIVDQIEQIAKHTNILALNATIEAARAGEAGRGFAVVANEVKNLANQTSKATTDIRSRITTLRQEIDAILTAMGEGAQKVDSGQNLVLGSVDKMRTVSSEIRDVTTLMRDIADHLGQQRVAAQEISQNLEGAAARSKSDTDAVNALIDISMQASAGLGDMLTELNQVEIRNAVILLAKSDHVVWRRHLAEMLAGRATLDHKELSNHHNCRLGKWCDSVEDRRILDHPAFRALEAPHRRVHELGIEAARRFNQGDFDGAVEAVAAIEEPSSEVQRLLDALAASFT
ncbi:MAG: methyl-accepting chemotaxis protein [Magnetospirillum sp.]|nr:methyl-accepting chemotaxis protein [Magnetospirillum sp.]